MLKMERHVCVTKWKKLQLSFAELMKQAYYIIKNSGFWQPHIRTSTRYWIKMEFFDSIKCKEGADGGKRGKGNSKLGFGFPLPVTTKSSVTRYSAQVSPPPANRTITPCTFTE